ncbi:MAG: TetR/AcrR family transcriptional regulator [Sneathiella sp.]
MSSKNNPTRIRILKAAYDLLLTQKGKGVRMTDIAKAVGISRQALYLHFPTRAELLDGLTRYLSDQKGETERLEASRTAATGIERLEAYVGSWASYIPEIYGLAKALLAMSDTDKAAAKTWADRMEDMREGCEAAILALSRDGTLSKDYTIEEATDLLWTMLSVRNWEHLTIDCGWSQEKYAETIMSSTRTLFVNEEAG